MCSTREQHAVVQENSVQSSQDAVMGMGPGVSIRQRRFLAVESDGNLDGNSVY